MFSTAGFAPDYAPEEIAEIATKLRGRAGLLREPTGRHRGGRCIRDQIAKRLRVGDCEALPVVVEVGEHVIRLAVQSLAQARSSPPL